MSSSPGYSYGEVWTVPRLLRIQPGGEATVVASGGKNGPWTAVTHHEAPSMWLKAGTGREAASFVSRRAEKSPFWVKRSAQSGRSPYERCDRRAGWVALFQPGTSTNSGLVGEDNARFGWLKRYLSFMMSRAGTSFSQARTLRISKSTS